jgi:hypothetical protein
LDQAGADQITNTFRVVHDARDEFADLSRIEVTDRQTRDLGLHLLAHFGDGALGGDAQDLGKTETRKGLDRGGDGRGDRDLPKQIGAAFNDHLIDQEFGGSGQHQDHRLINHH